MSDRKTIAIAGPSATRITPLISRFVQLKHRVLLVSDQEDKLERACERIRQGNQGAGVETVHCMKDGCWEADMIIIPADIENPELLAEKIKEVATRKTVVVVSELVNRNPVPQATADLLEQKLPYSPVIRLYFSVSLMESIIYGDNQEALAEVNELIRSAGFRTSIWNPEKA